MKRDRVVILSGVLCLVLSSTLRSGSLLFHMFGPYVLIGMGISLLATGLFSKRKVIR